MIDFTIVSREFRSLVARRRELMTLLGSVFAALAIILDNILQGRLPEALRAFEASAFSIYALLLLVPSLLLALRTARLSRGMTLNGILYARLMQEQDFAPHQRGDPERASRLNVKGVSFIMFLFVDVIAGFAVALLVLAWFGQLWLALLLALAVVLAWLLLFLSYHRGAVRFAMAKIAAEPCGKFDRNEWEGHVSGSLEDVNHDMTTIIAFVGLITFAVFQGLTGLGQLPRGKPDLAPQQVQDYGPIVYASLMLVTCLMGLATYLRLRHAVGLFSLQLDPTDRPFRPLRLTDSLLGYLILAFLFVVSLHVLLHPHLELPTLFLIDALAFAGAVLAEQVSLVRWARQVERGKK